MIRLPVILTLTLAALAVAAPAGAAASAPHLLRYDDTSRFAVRPATLSFGADGGVLVLGPGVSASEFRAGQDGHIRWTRWNATAARGVATVWLNQCRPDCAAAHYKSYPVIVQASQVQNARYTNLTLSYQSKVVRYHLKRFGRLWGWQ